MIDDDTSLSLEDALACIAAGDHDAFEEVYRRTSAKLFGVCLRVVASDDAEEVLQDVYLAVWNKAASFDASRRTPMTWLITLARNRAIDFVRRAGKSAKVPLDDAVGVADPVPLANEMIEEREQAQRLIECFERIDKTDAGFIRSTFFTGTTYRDLAAVAGIPLGTIKSRIRRSLLKLRACLA